MKKVLAIVLSLSMVLGSFGFAFAAEDTTSKKTTSNKSTNFSDVVGTDCEDAVKVLTDLGVVTGYDDGSYKPENIVTRAEMAVLVVNALGLQSYVTEGAKSTFTDMANYGWAEGYIAYAQSLGVISGYGDGTFQPGKTVSYDEVATMLVAALGYTPESLQGTWPANYVTQAKAKGILDGITAGPNGANRGDVATMIYQTLDQAIGKVNKDGDWKSIGITFDSNGNATEWDNMLNRLGAKVYDKATMMGKNGDEFIVTKSIADDESVINLYPYIGARVKAYMNSDDDIIAIKEVVSTFLTGEYDDPDTFSVGDVDYDVKTSVVGSTEAAMYFLNGDALSVTTQVTSGGVATQPNKNFNVNDTSAMDFGGDSSYTLAADVSGKTIKQIYSISYWHITDKDKFASSDASDIKDDKSLMGVDFPQDDNGDIDLNGFELVGVDSLNDIKTDNVVYVYENDDKEIARVAVGTEVVTGEVSKTSGGTNGDDKITIDGKVYKRASNFTDKIKAGDTMTLYLDAYGKIYDAKRGAGTPDDYAIVLDFTATASTAMGGTDPQMKLFLADGSDKTFDIDTDAIEDGTIKGATKSAVSGDITISGISSGDIIGYSVNKSGKLDEITTYAAVDYPRAVANKSISSKGNFDGKEIEKSVVLFTYDGSDLKKAGNYGTATYESVLDSDDISSVDYILDDGKIVAMRLDGFSSSNDIYGIITDFSTIKTDYDYEITAWVNGKEVTYKSDDKQSGTITTSGAVYQLKFDGNGALKKLTAANEGVKSGNVKDTTFRAIAVGTTPLTKDGNVLKGGDTSVNFTLDSSVVIYKWNVKDGAYEKGSWSDIVKTTGASIGIELFDVDGNDQVYDIVTYWL